MAQNDIIVPREGAGGVLTEFVLADATTSARGLLSASDKTKLDGIAAGAEVNVNADWTASSGDAQILNKPSSFTPSAHAAAHAATGSDPLFDQDLNTTDNVEFNSFSIPSAGIFFDTNGVDLGDTVYQSSGIVSDWGNNISFEEGNFSGSWNIATADHTHGNLTNDGKIGSTAGLPVVTTTAGAVTTIALGTAGQVLTVNSGATGVEFAAASGGGGSKAYAVFTATDNQPPATNFMTLDARNSIAVLDADDATDESAVFVGIIPEGASLGSGLKIRLHWMATTATSGNVVWDVSLERMTTDLDSDSFDTIASGTAAANGTSGILTVTEITLTTIDSVTAGDGFRLKVTRDANNASDTMTGDAELVAVEIRSAA